MSLLFAKAMGRLLYIRNLKVALGETYIFDEYCSSDPYHVGMMFFFSWMCDILDDALRSGLFFKADSLCCQSVRHGQQSGVNPEQHHL